MDAEAVKQILQDIEDKILNNVKLGFDPAVLDVLSNPDAAENEIEVLKSKIGDEILARLFSVANSIYFGHLRRGNVDTFYKVVSRLGMDSARVLIIFLAFAALSKDREVLTVCAKNSATSIIGGRILAEEFGLKESEARKVEIGGLFFEMGRVVFALYKSLHREDYEKAGIGEDFIAEHQPYFGLKIVEKFNLPEFLKGIISTKYLTLEAELVSLAGIIIIANSIVDASFRRFGNRLVVVSPMPDPEGRIVHTIGAVIEATFKAVGLGGYIEIHKPPEPDQKSTKDR